MEKEFEDLINQIREHNPQAKFDEIKKAWEFAKLAHTGQKRLSGEAFVLHPLRVAAILASWKMDSTSLIAALTHDTVEDGGATREDLVGQFGEEVARLVDGVTKITGYRLKGSRQEQFVENLRKMLLVMSKDLRVVFIKLADRLHNMRTLGSLPRVSREENAAETLEIYAPLAERLGIGKVKGELEDLAFPYVYPEDYKKVSEFSKGSFKRAEADIETMKKAILSKLARAGVKAEIHARKKHLYSLWKKLLRPEIDWDFEKVNDIVALRILVPEISDCYVTLGVVHNTYKPVPRIGISDYIAQPKPNGYRSIHTKVFGPRGRIVEVQIRTYQMHEEAELGLAAHWSYSEAKQEGVGEKQLETGKATAKATKLAWVRELVSWQKELADSEEFIKAVKFDALKHRNFVFSPVGDVYDLPMGATPVDFAYMVHTKLGNFIQGAKVDGKIVPLNYKLKSGQVVEILTSKNPKKPNSDWLEFVVTNLARREISKQLRADS